MRVQERIERVAVQVVIVFFAVIFGGLMMIYLGDNFHLSTRPINIPIAIGLMVTSTISAVGSRAINLFVP